jgi:hypothetical protein
MRKKEYHTSTGELSDGGGNCKEIGGTSNLKGFGRMGKDKPMCDKGSEDGNTSCSSSVSDDESVPEEFLLDEPPPEKSQVSEIGEKKRKRLVPMSDDEDQDDSKEGEGVDLKDAASEDGEGGCATPLVPASPRPPPKKPRKAPAQPHPRPSPGSGNLLRQPLCKKVLDMVFNKIVPIGILLEAAEAAAGAGPDHKKKIKAGSAASGKGPGKIPRRTSFIFTEDDALLLVVKQVVRSFPAFQDKTRTKDIVAKFLSMLYTETHKEPIA